MESVNGPQKMAPSEALFRSYLRAPVLAIPTLVLMVAMLLLLGVSWFLAIEGTIPLWLGCLLNGIAAYGLFGVAHDSTHRAVSSIPWINEALGMIAMLFLVPFVPMSALRWMHMQHHRFTNGEMDPDRFMHASPWYQVPIRWTCFDVYYAYYFLKYGGAFARKSYGTIALYFALVIAFIAAVIHAGYGYELLMLWILPSRIALFLITVVFVILPHYPGVVSHNEDAYLATTMRLGWEWLLTPLLTYHNYHLIHHLYPTIPFYKMHKAWYLKYDDIMRHNVSIQKPFGLTPQNIELHKSYASLPK